jgi:hypothetical protein
MFAGKWHSINYFFTILAAKVLQLTGFNVLIIKLKRMCEVTWFLTIFGTQKGIMFAFPELENTFFWLETRSLSQITGMGFRAFLIALQ